VVWGGPEQETAAEVNVGVTEGQEEDVVRGGPEQETAAEITVGITGGPKVDVVWGGTEQETAAEVSLGVTGGLYGVIERITEIQLVGALSGTSVIYAYG